MARIPTADAMCSGPVLAAISVSHEEINRLVMNYLIVEGYKDGAVCFQKESGVQYEENFDSELIEARANIKELICGGDIESAIKAINELNPDVSFDALKHLDLGQKCRALLPTQKTIARSTY